MSAGGAVGGGSCKSQAHGSIQDGRSPRSDAAGQTFPKQRDLD